MNECINTEHLKNVTDGGKAKYSKNTSRSAPSSEI